MTDAPAVTRQGGQALAALATCLLATGFDVAAYLRDNRDLLAAGMDEAAALLHFVIDGCAEHRPIVCGPLPAGLGALSLFPFADRRHAALLVRRVFQAQLRHPHTAEQMWQAADPGLVAMLRSHGGVPYVVIGDSHAGHYGRADERDGAWLAPMVMTCPGATAAGLANEQSRTRTGDRILEWARGPAHRHGRFDAPIILAFGGMDAEYVWMMRRIRNRIDAFSSDEYAAFASESVRRYARFVERLCESVDPALLRICAVFPATLFDEHWTQGFIGVQSFGAAQAGETLDVVQLAKGIARTERPGLPVRTRLRALYNDHLKSMCARLGLGFIDAFTPLLGPAGTIRPRYVEPHGGRDHHVDYVASEAPLVPLIWDAVGR